MNFPNGDCYEGHWADDNRDGYGVLKLQRGDVYEGEWRDDKMHGHGTLRHYEGSVYQGIWENGERVDQQGTYSSPSGV